jgi:uncharacterized protein
MSHKFALITGASTGIGYELSQLFAKDGYHLILVARNISKLNEVEKELEIKYSIAVETFQMDLSKEDTPELLYSEIKKNNWTIDVLVNNAGIGVNGCFHESPLKDQMEMIDLNVNSLVKLTSLFLKDMIQNNSGKILMIGSTAGFQPGPYMAGYYASKAFVLHFSEALSVELEKTNVSISILCPGPTLTEFHKRAKMLNSNLFRGPFIFSARKVAEIGYKGLMKNKLIIIPGFLNSLMSFLVRFSPRALTRQLAGYLNKSDSF